MPVQALFRVLGESLDELGVESFLVGCWPKPISITPHENAAHRDPNAHVLVVNTEQSRTSPSLHVAPLTLPPNINSATFAQGIFRLCNEGVPRLLCQSRPCRHV